MHCALLILLTQLIYICVCHLLKYSEVFEQQLKQLSIITPKDKGLLNTYKAINLPFQNLQHCLIKKY